MQFWYKCVVAILENMQRWNLFLHQYVNILN